MEVLNREDLCSWVRMAKSVSKRGPLLLAAETLKTAHCAVSLFGIGKRTDLIIRVNAKLVGNMLAIHEIPKEKGEHAEPKTSADSCGNGRQEPLGLIILERITVELADRSESLPFPFNIVFMDGSHCQFSAPSDEERNSWMELLGKASNEQSQVEADFLRAQPDSGSKKNDIEKIPGPEFDMELTSSLFSNLIKQRHIFKPQDGTDLVRPIICEEWMLESRLSLTMPAQFLNQYVSRCRKLKKELESAIPYLPDHEETLRAKHCRAITQNLTRYQRVLDFLETWDGPFKQSIRRDREELLFVPTNLHWQRFVVKEEKGWEWADWMTSGCVSATALGYPHGGAKKMTKSLIQSMSRPDAINDCDEQQYSQRRTKLKLIAKRITAVRAMEKKTSEWTFEGYKRDFGVKVLRETREMYDMIRAWVDRFPHIHGTVETLVDFYEARKKPSFSMRSSVSLGDSLTIGEHPPENLDSLLTETEAVLVSLETKIQGLAQEDVSKSQDKETRLLWLESARGAVFRALSIMDRLCELLSDAQILRLIHSLGRADVTNFYHTLQYRSDIILTQAVVVVSTGILGKLWFLPTDENYDDLLIEKMESWVKGTDVLFGIVSHLSCRAEEKCMMEDMCEAWSQLRDKCAFRFVRAFSSLKASAIVPIVELSDTGFLISLPIPGRIFGKLSEPIQAGANFRVYPIFWNIGINHDTFLANNIGDNSLEKEINEKALYHMQRVTVRRLQAYISSFGQSKGLTEKRKMQLRQAQSIAKQMDTEIKKNADKNVKVLRLAAKVCKVLGGEVLLCCKSGKDRTAMGITLEEAQLLRETKGLPESLIQETLDTLRRDGVRRQNCLKNVGIGQYAFSAYQMPFLPKDYKPPAGTYRQFNLLPT